MKKNLAVLDMDGTIQDAVSDLVVRDLLNANLISDEIKQLHKSTGFVKYMQMIFKLVHLNGVLPDDIIQAIKVIPEVPGMINCIRTLSIHNFDIVIISDSNTELIKIWTDHNNITPLIHSIFANPAAFNDKGLLELQPYHHQTECELSTANLCKGQILEDFIRSRKEHSEPVHYASTYFVGDGRNDICPMLRLPFGGYACPRIGYYCSNELENVIANKHYEMKAKIQRWSNGNDLLNFILNTCEKWGEN
jgi:pyridoxal phosphate phosphatase PHOSPHO2